MKEIKGRKQQRGYFGELILLVVSVIVLLIGAAVVVPTVIAIKQRSIGWGLVATALLAACVYLYVNLIVVPGESGKANREWIEGAEVRCSRELATIQPEFQAEGVLDSSGALQSDWIVPMLTERRLRYIEVKGGDRSPISVTRYLESLDWTGGQTPWIRMRLSRDGDPMCVAVPPGLKDALKRPPFDSGTCLALEAVAEPAAALEVKQIQPADQPSKAYGSWGVVHRATGKTLAQLTTIDTAGSARTEGRLLGKGERRANDGCRLPVQLLFERIYGSDERPMSEQVFAQSLVRATELPDTLSLNADRLTPVQAEVAVRHLTREQVDALKEPTWAAALESAKVVGGGGFKEMHINAITRELVQLDIDTGMRTNRWQVLGDARGFFVFEQSPVEERSRERHLFHYDHVGRVLGAFRIQLGDDSPWSSRPVQSIRIEGGSLFLKGQVTWMGQSTWQIEELRFRLGRQRKSNDGSQGPG